MKRVCILVVSLAIPLQLGAGGQNQMPLLAYDACGRSPDPWVIVCDVRLVEGDSNSISVMRSEGVGMPGVKPAWSADGLRIAVGGEYLLVYNLAEGTTRYLTHWAGPPSWSPDNTRIAFASNRDGQDDLYVIKDDGSALTRLTDNVGFRGWFAWSPDGTAIAYAATIGGVPELFVMQADGSNKRRLTYNVGFDTHTIFQVTASASWSPDGTRIAFDCANDICAINQDGTGFTQLTTDPVAAVGAVFSPVDGRIAFATGRFGSKELAILEVNGAVTRVAPGMWAGHQTWSAGGDRLAFVLLAQWEGSCDYACYPEQYERVFTVNSDGTSLREIGNGHHPRWAPTPSGQPVATFVSNCTGSSCQFAATNSFDPDGNIASYRWVFGDGTTATGVTAAHQYAIGGDYNVTLIVTDNSGTNGITFRAITANSPPVAAFTATCNGPMCTFDASASSDPDGTISDYVWTFGDGSSLYGAGATEHIYASGTFLATLYVRDNAGLSASAEATVTVVNAVPVAAFTATCSGLTCTLDASASSDDDVLSYRWDLGNGSSSTTWDKVAIRVLPAAGTYQITLTVTDIAGHTATSSRAVTVVPLPLPEIHVGNLTGSSNNLKNTWSPYVTVQMHRDNHQVVSGIQVNATWSNGSTQSCATGTDGTCWFALDLIPNKTSVATLTITGVVTPMWAYKPTANHDADGGSNGTVITVRRR